MREYFMQNLLFINKYFFNFNIFHQFFLLN
nr:MAG TPA: hypothetical protein [Caudoviricetes sp.]